MSANLDIIEGSSLNNSDSNEFIQKFIIYLNKLCYLFFFDNDLTINDSCGNNNSNSYNRKSLISSEGSLITIESKDVINRFLVSSEYPALIIECINHRSGI